MESLRHVVALGVLLAPVAGCDAGPATEDSTTTLVDEQADDIAALRAQVGDLPVVVVELEPVMGDRRAVAALVADDARSRQQGLMGVEQLAEGTGILFVFDTPTTGGFWMSGTHIALDIAFIRDGEVVATATMQPCRKEPCPVTRPPQPYDAALEVPAGWYAQVGVNAGATVAW